MTSTAVNRRRPAWIWVAAEVLLVATTIAGILMLRRLFDDESFIGPLVFAALVSHGLLIAMRWLRFGVLLSGAASLVGAIAATVATNYPETAIASVIPTGDTVDQLRVDLTAAREVFENLQAPVPAVTGLIVCASLLLWAAAFIADWAAFRLRSPGQAMAPMLAALVLVSLLGTSEGRLESTSLLVACGVLFVLATRAADRADRGLWLGRGAGRGYGALMASGAIVSAFAVFVAVVGGPRLPGADEKPLVEVGSGAREEKKPLEVISPLVEIKPRLTDQSDVVQFVVRADEPAYWRVNALDEFDGQLWGLSLRARDAERQLEVAYKTDEPARINTQVYDIAQINAVWAPAAYAPSGFEELTGRGVKFEPESATLIVDTDSTETSNGLRYRVESAMHDFTPERLSELASASTGSTIDGRYLDLPDSLSPIVRDTAAEITAGLDDPYLKARAIQDWFRENFTYDLDVAAGHEINRISDFLEVRRGYCEQFAGSFAAMARSVGLPTRLAVGYTWGDEDPNQPGQYTVRGRHAHAWPEVHIEGAGWLAFEPTPGRGAPNTSAYTGAPQAQDSFQAPEPAEIPEQASAEQTAAAESAPAAPAPTPTPMPQPEPEPEPVIEAAADETGTTGSSSFPFRLVLIYGLALLAVLAWLFGVPALKRRRLERRRGRFGSDRRRAVALAWSETVDLLESHGLGPRAHETLFEYSARLQEEPKLAQQRFGELTSLASAAAYDEQAPDVGDVDRATAIALQIGASLRASQGWVERNATELDPRPLLRRRDPVAARAERIATGATSVLEQSSDPERTAQDVPPA